MKQLEIIELENLNGGDAADALGCGIAIIGFGLATASLVTLTAATGGLGAFIAVAGFSIAPAGVALSCLS